MTNWRNSTTIKIATILIIAAVLILELFVGLTESQDRYVSEKMGTALTLLLTIYLIDALVRIRGCLGNFDRNFKIYVA